MHLSLHTVVPSILEAPLSSVQMLSPSPLSLNCTADGFPLPTIAWTRTVGDATETLSMADIGVGDGSFYISSDPNPSMMTVQSIFRIDPTMVQDTAEYRCRANNTLGAIVSSPSLVTVHG